MVSIGAVSVNNIPEKINSSSVIPGPKPVIEKAIDSLERFIDKLSFKNLTKNHSENKLNNLSFVDNNKTINKNTKVLIIGDSQTYGNYGATLDNLVRDTKAKVITYASWGSSPEWWMSGQVTKGGLWSKGIDGKESRVQEAKTPSIEKILKEEKPNIVIVTMGGNMMANATQKSVTDQVDKIGKAVTSSGAKLIWAGPPKYDPQKRTPEQLETFYGFLAKAVSAHGTFIDSRKFISEYHGNDGLHYSGRKGNKETEKWANGVFNEIQKAKLK